MEYKMYHKSTCSTSNKALKLLKENGIVPETIDYIVNAPSKRSLQALVKKLKIQPSQLVRKKERVYKENYEGKSISEGAWIDILHENPILIERPILIKGRKALIGRPVERVLELI
jgi:arsenate reductase